MTEKLYYKDAYMSEFDSKVTEVKTENGKTFVALEATAFFPEGGGQTSDKGELNGIEVVDVQEKNGIIYHEIKGTLETGEAVHGKINFKERYEKMQCHTAEHILSGTIHRLFGYENVGFHLSSDYVTFDISNYMDREELDRVEKIANEAVYANVHVEVFFPTAEELPNIEYRSKLDLTENVRIVKIGDYDSCACCAPHVKRTGEIGVIKILDFEKHRGGVRVYMTAGSRALNDYKERYFTTLKISGLLSTPQGEISEAVEKLLSDFENEKRKNKEMILDFARWEAEKLEPTDKNKVVYLKNSNMDGLREFVKVATSKVSGILVSLCGEENDYKYVITSNTTDLKKMSKEINEKICGRGGGRPEMIQGSSTATLEEIISAFENK